MHTIGALSEDQLAIQDGVARTGRAIGLGRATRSRSAPLSQGTGVSLERGLDRQNPNATPTRPAVVPGTVDPVMPPEM